MKLMKQLDKLLPLAATVDSTLPRAKLEQPRVRKRSPTKTLYAFSMEWKFPATKPQNWEIPFQGIAVLTVAYKPTMCSA